MKAMNGMKKITSFVCAAALLCGVLALLPACGRQEATEIETGAEGECLFSISLSYPYLDNYNIEVTDCGYLTTVRGTGEKKVQKTVLLSERTFSRIRRMLERLDFASPPQTEMTDVGDVDLYLNKTNQRAYFTYGYVTNHRKTDKPFVDFTKAVIALSPIPVLNLYGKPVRPFRIPRLFFFIIWLL